MFVQSSDWHLSNYIWADRPLIFGDSFRAAQQIVDYAIIQEVPLLILGDLFNTKRPEPEAVACFTNLMDQMERSRVPVYVTQGQHELNRGSVIWAEIHGWPQHMNRRGFEIAGRKFWGLDWLPRGELQEALREIPADVEFLCCHQVWEEFMGSMCATDGSINEIPANVRFVLTGDFHAHRIIQVGNKTVVSTGSTHLRAINEEYPKRIFIYDGQQFFSQPIINRELAAGIEIPTEESLVDFIKSVEHVQRRDPDRRPIWTIRVRMDVPEWKSRLDAAIGERAHVFYDPQPVYDETVEVAEEVILTAQGGTPGQVMSKCAESVVTDNAAVLTKVQGLLAQTDKKGATEYWQQLFAKHVA